MVVFLNDNVIYKASVDINKEKKAFFGSTKNNFMSNKIILSYRKNENGTSLSKYYLFIKDTRIEDLHK